jgi:hypothetical protein
MSQPPYSGPPYPDQPSSGQPYPGQPSSGQPYQGGQQYPGQQYPGQQYPGQQYPEQPYPQQAPNGQPYPPQQPSYPGQAYPAQGYPGQAYPGQPNPDVPTSVPPQPGYPAAYGQPDYVQEPGYGMIGAPPPAPPKKSKAVPIILVSLAVLLVLCLGGAAVIFFAARDSADDITEAAESAATPEPTAPTAPPTTEDVPAPAGTITIVEPKTLGGRPKLTDPQFADVAKELQAGLADVPGATNTVGALYGTPSKQDIVVVAGVEAPVDNPTQELNGTFLGAGVGGLKVTGITPVEPGPLGGVAKCGKSKESGVDMVLCGWADDGSVGWIIWYFKSVGKAKAEFPQLRGQIEKSS